MRHLLLAALIALSTSSVARAQVTPYYGQIAVMGTNFCPVGWARADGSLLSIADNDALFSLLGTKYGGDGQTTFALPKIAVVEGTGQTTSVCIALEGMYPTPD